MAALVIYLLLLGNGFGQLLKDGESYHHFSFKSKDRQSWFSLGKVTEATKGIYRCRYNNEGSWSEFSNPVELTGTGLVTKLLCHGPLRSVSFVLRKAEDHQFVRRYESGHIVGTFHILQPGNYSCSYEIIQSGLQSQPSQMVTIEELDFFPAPSFDRRNTDVIPKPGSSVELRLIFHFTIQEGSRFSCRYALSDQHSVWSRDSDPVEILVSDESLPTPTLSLTSKNLSLTRGSNLVLRCQGPLAGATFVLLKEKAEFPLQVVTSAGHSVDFRIPDIGAHVSGNYSCLYVESRNGSAGSKPSKPLELRLEGLMPKPMLWSVWRNIVTPGLDATLHCMGPLVDMQFELLREEQVLLSWSGPWGSRMAEFILYNVGPKDTGNYTCRYHLPGGQSLVRSEDSDPMELLVEKELY
ncbi:alpha-1B-glycoprotein-like [Rhynchocyon petersi]